MVIGAGIFKTSPVVAASLADDHALYAAWAFGGLLSFIGALCYAEMAAAFPDAGGDYQFLRRAYGPRIGLLFAWSRFAVIHTGSMALLAFVFGDYLVGVLPAGLLPTGYASPLCATAIVIALTLLNLLGVRVGLGTQLGLMALVLAGLLLVGSAGAWIAWQGLPPATPRVAVQPPAETRHEWGTALVFVFLAYGGWSDAATLSSELRDARRGIVRALVIGLALVTGLYLLANWGYVRGLGLDGLAASEAPAADLVRRAFGRPAEWVMVALVSITAVTVLNAMLIAGARTTYAAARDLCAARPQARDLAARVLPPLARWDVRHGVPRVAVLAIGAVALALVGLGTLTRGGFSTLVDYLSPVYWAFLVLSGLAPILLRRRHPQVERPFRVPLYPLLPLAFTACSIYVLVSSLIYVKVGAVVGLAVLALGALLLAPLGRVSLRDDAADGPG